MTEAYAQLQVPARLARLKDLAYNLWWSWNLEARALFKEIDRNLWRTTLHNPVQLLLQSQERLEVLAKDEAFLKRYDALISTYDHDLTHAAGNFDKKHPGWGKKRVAYFSAEFGVHNSLRIYSGGLGILAGDHCKTASDLGVPLVGVGFMYPQGYVQQRIGSDGWQQNVYEQVDWDVSPVRPVFSSPDERLILNLELGSWKLRVAVWEVQVGRVPLYLLDTHVEGNSPADQEISGRLYGGDRTMRLRQEIVLGIGGVRMLRALGVPAGAFHANEGHSSFMFLELIREKVAEGKTFAQAAKEVASQAVFTTHTPVPAGHDVFAEELIAEYFKGYWEELGVDREEFMALARVPGQSGWNMTALALRLSDHRNAVSERHGHVSRAMWKKLWPEKEEKDVPIAAVTNGVHMGTWIHQELSWVYAKHFGADFWARQDDPKLWDKVAKIPDEELWRVHQMGKAKLLRLLRDRARRRWVRGIAEPQQVLTQGVLLDPATLTIGFARRFAGYKRATLILQDLERLKKLLFDRWRPVQILFAGKAHPADDGGKALIQEIYRVAKDPVFGGRVVFVEDYDMHVARYLVQGCDLWLNNPLAPMEACGTSGIKAAANGVPSLSILDGWWEEGFNGKNGWSVGKPGGCGSGPEADQKDREEIFRMLEQEIVPLFYDRGADGVPHGWIKVMKEAIRTVTPRFSGNRMVTDYVEKLYAPCIEGSKKALAGSRR